MKKIISFVLTMIFTLSITLSSISAQTTTYFPDYSGNGPEESAYYERFDSDNLVTYYGKTYNGVYYNLKGIPTELNSKKIDYIYYNDYYFKVLFKKDKFDYVTREDFFRALFDMQISSYLITDIEHPGNPNDFIDYSNFTNYTRLIKYLSGYTTQSGQKLFSGNLKEDGVYLDFNSLLTRAEAAKIFVCLNDISHPASQKREKKYFLDCYNHWGNDYIAEAYALGYINGVDENNFMPDEHLTYEQMIQIYKNFIYNSWFYNTSSFANILLSCDFLCMLEKGLTK